MTLAVVTIVASIKSTPMACQGRFLRDLEDLRAQYVEPSLCSEFYIILYRAQNICWTKYHSS